jgi:hypothetical protein
VAPSAFSKRWVAPFELIFGENQFALAGASESVDLAIVFDPNLFAAAGEGVEFDDFWKDCFVGRVQLRRGRRVDERVFWHVCVWQVCLWQVWVGVTRVHVSLEVIGLAAVQGSRCVEASKLLREIDLTQLSLHKRQAHATLVDTDSQLAKVESGHVSRSDQ